jgi:adenylate kinase
VTPPVNLAVMGRRVLFLGPPGAGKGTQAAMLATALGVPHISTGAMLRDAVAAGTDLGRRADAIMKAGDLVPDDLVVAMVAERLARSDAACGYLLDGFPRNVAQAKALDAALSDGRLEVALLLDADEDELVRRLLERARLEGRADDNEETIRNRQRVYASETAPLVEYYPSHGVDVVSVDGLGSIDEVFSRVVRALVREP